jgi:hypothetical protein
VEELSGIEGVEVINAHDNNGYASFLEKYFKKEKKKIDSFIKNSKKSFAKDVQRGDIDVEEAVPHGTASPVSATRLYAINKWANENDIDLVLHVHFNDYGSRVASGGVYSGFSVYVPNSELKNGRKSIPIGKKIHASLKRIMFPSNNPSEAKYSSAIEDHELIALGANNTLKVPSVLIEYSYIYEAQLHSEFFERIAVEYAHRTVVGLSDFLKTGSKQSDLTSYTWKDDREEDNMAAPSLDVYMLQLALKANGTYPTYKEASFECPITGVFTICTKDALMKFQKKNGMKQTGELDAATRAVLNKMY